MKPGTLHPRPALHRAPHPGPVMPSDPDMHGKRLTIRVGRAEYRGAPPTVIRMDDALLELHGASGRCPEPASQVRPAPVHFSIGTRGPAEPGKSLRHGECVEGGTIGAGNAASDYRIIAAGTNQIVPTSDRENRPPTHQESCWGIASLRGASARSWGNLGPAVDAFRQSSPSVHELPRATRPN